MYVPLTADQTRSSFKLVRKLRSSMRIVLIVFTTAIFLTGCNREHWASANLDGGVRVSLVVSGMFSLQSDWSRTLIVEHRGKKISRVLSEDTGWWRGSNLYLATAGVFVLDEGQNGCIAFRLDPVRFDDAAARCRKRTARLARADASGKNDSSKSEVYPEMLYLGRFAEVLADPVPVEFIAVSEAPEIRLPDPP